MIGEYEPLLHSRVGGNFNGSTTRMASLHAHFINGRGDISKKVTS